MPTPTLRARLRYRLDNLMSRGPAPLIGLLFLATAAVVIVVTIVVVLLNWGDESGFNPLDVLWRAILTTLDSGAVGNYTGTTATPSFLLAMLVVTLTGILVTSILIGLLVTGLEGRLEELRKGRSPVIESGHTGDPRLVPADLHHHLRARRGQREPAPELASSCSPTATRSRWRTTSATGWARPDGPEWSAGRAARSTSATSSWSASARPSRS